MQRCKRILVDYVWANCWLVGLSLNLIFLGTTVLRGQDTWQGPTTDPSWLTRTNWSLGSPPARTQDALIDNGTTAQFANATSQAGGLSIGLTTAGSTLQMLPQGTLTVSSVLIGTGGTIRFSGGTLKIVADHIVNNGTILFDGSPDESSGVGVSGTGKMVMDISGTLFVSADNTYSGGTILTNGTLLAQSATALSPNSAFTVNSILNLGGFNNTIGSLSGTGTVLNSGEGAATLSVGNDNTNTTFSGVLKDGTSVLELTKIGTGTLDLTGANTYTGTTTINAGTLQLGNGGTTGSIAGNVVDNGTLALIEATLSRFPE